MEILVKYEEDRTYGSLNGLFICHQEELDAVIGTHIHWGEVLGKYSEVSSDLNQDMFEIITDEPDVIELFRKHEWRGTGTILGFNPVARIKEDE